MFWPGEDLLSERTFLHPDGVFVAIPILSEWTTRPLHSSHKNAAMLVAKLCEDLMRQQHTEAVVDNRAICFADWGKAIVWLYVDLELTLCPAMKITFCVLRTSPSCSKISEPWEALFVCQAVMFSSQGMPL